MNELSLEPNSTEIVWYYTYEGPTLKFINKQVLFIVLNEGRMELILPSLSVLIVSYVCNPPPYSSLPFSDFKYNNNFEFSFVLFHF